jgi:glycosyltransferase involved in cell wall biosynthesis
VVDDCSTEGTWPILQRLADEDKRITLLSHEVNRGKGPGVRTGAKIGDARNSSRLGDVFYSQQGWRYLL